MSWGPPAVSLISVSYRAWGSIFENPSAFESSFLSLIDWKMKWLGAGVSPLHPRYLTCTASIRSATKSWRKVWIRPWNAMQRPRELLGQASRRWEWSRGPSRRKSRRPGSPRSACQKDWITLLSAATLESATGLCCRVVKGPVILCLSLIWGQPHTACIL